MSLIKSRIEELIPEYVLDVNIETKVHQKSTYFQKNRPRAALDSF